MTSEMRSFESMFLLSNLLCSFQSDWQL